MRSGREAIDARQKYTVAQANGKKEDFVVDIMNRVAAISMLMLSLIAVTKPTTAQTTMADVEIKVEHVAGAIYMLEGAGGNIAASVGADGILIVDDQFAPLAPKIRTAIKDLHNGKISYVLNTHHHADHTGGNAEFAAEARIIGHTNVRTRLSRPRQHKKESLPVITFDDSLSVHFNGEEIQMIHFPNGHTDSDSIVIFTGSNVVHMGDLLFTASFPSFYTNEGGDIEGYARNVGEIIELMPEDARIIAGHGRLATLDDVKDFYAMLVDTTGIVRKQIEAGKTLEDVQAAGLPEEYDRWESSFTSVEQWVTKVYRNLAE